MDSEMLKMVARELRTIFRQDGVSNRNLSVTTRSVKCHGKTSGYVYVSVRIPNSAIDAYAEPIVNEFKERFEADDFHIVLEKAADTFNGILL